MGMKDNERQKNINSENLISKLLMKFGNFGNNILSGSRDEEHNLKTKAKSDTGKSEKKGISRVVIWLCIIAIVLLFAIRTLGADGGQKTKLDNENEKHEVMAGNDTYVSDMESDLKEILEKIEGAGNVSVRIYIDSTTEKILAEDSKSESEVSEKENEKTESNTNEKSTVISSSSGGIGGSGSPYVVREKLPYPIGVIVVADGAKNERIRTEMYEAVKALYGLSANRIKITY